MNIAGGRLSDISNLAFGTPSFHNCLLKGITTNIPPQMGLKGYGRPTTRQMLVAE
jgi:hypothetical protein